MKKKLFVSDDAPEVLKEIIGVSQKMADNLSEFKSLSKARDLTFEDLEELTRRNNLLADEFPEAEPSATGYPKVDSFEDLEAIAEARGKETARLLEKEGGPVYPIESFDQLKELSKMPPATIGKLILHAAKQKREKTSEKKPKVKKSSLSLPKRSFLANVFIEHLAKIETLLYNAKTVFHDLSYDWENAELFEEKLFINAKSFEEFRQSGVYFLVKVLSGKEDENDVKDLKAEAAFILATVETENRDELDKLIDIWKNNNELSPVIIQALKCGGNPTINDKLASNLLTELSLIQAAFVEILSYRNAINHKLFKQLQSNQDPVVGEKITRAYINANLPIENSSFDPLLEDDEAPYYEDALFSGILAGKFDLLTKTRKRFHDTRDKMINLPLYFSCGCQPGDSNWIKLCLDEEQSRQSAIMALGMLGLGGSIITLIKCFSDRITSKEDWETQRKIVGALELITGERLELSMPDIREGPEGKEFEVKVVISWKRTWSQWWAKNGNQYREDIRYRRGRGFDLGSCIAEMECPRGNYWSRQYSYFELQARSGKHIAPFFADWYVKEQKESIEKWKQWWQENKERIGDSQWLFAGKAPLTF